MLAIVAGSGGAQLVAIAAAPIISRLYGPAEIGLFTVVSTTALIVGSVAALKFDAAVPLPEREVQAHSLVILGIISAVVTGLVGLVAVAASGKWAAQAFQQPDLAGWLYIAPVVAAVIGGFAVLNQHAIRHGRFAAVGRRNAAQGITMSVVQVIAGSLGLKTGGMIAGFGSGQIVGAVSLTFGARLRSPEAREGRTMRELKAAARRYRHFPLALAPSGLLNIAGLHAPILLIAWLYGDEVAGWLGMTQRILALPLSLVGVAIGQVFLSELTRAHRERSSRARVLFTSATRKLAIVGVGLCVLVGTAGPYLFTLALGEQWRISGVYAQALSVTLAVQLVVSPLSQTLTVYERQGTQLAWDAARLAAVVGAVLAAHALAEDPLATIWAYSTATSVAYVVAWLLAHQAICTAELDSQAVKSV